MINCKKNDPVSSTINGIESRGEAVLQIKRRLRPISEKLYLFLIFLPDSNKPVIQMHFLETGEKLDIVCTVDINEVLNNLI